MDVKSMLTSQYLASLEMLARAVDACPEILWTDPKPKNAFWHVAYHVLFYTHLYLQESESMFTPWVKHRKESNFLGPLPWPPHREPEKGPAYPKEAVLEYLDFCRREVRSRMPLVNLESPSGFEWLPFDKLELQVYNIRHLQHHTAQLLDRLRNEAGTGVGWVGMMRS